MKKLVWTLPEVVGDLQELGEAGAWGVRIKPMVHKTPNTALSQLDEAIKLYQRSGFVCPIVDIGGARPIIDELPGGAGALILASNDPPVTLADRKANIHNALIVEINFARLREKDRIEVSHSPVVLEVIRIGDLNATCSVEVGGRVKPGLGLSIIREGKTLTRLPDEVLSDKDCEFLEEMAKEKLKPKGFTPSFIESKHDLYLLNQALARWGFEEIPHHLKVETETTLDNAFELAASSQVCALVQARNDLSRNKRGAIVMPRARKRIARACQQYDKEPWVASYILKSLETSNEPSPADEEDLAAYIEYGFVGFLLALDVEPERAAQVIAKANQIIMQIEKEIPVRWQEGLHGYFQVRALQEGRSILSGAW